MHTWWLRANNVIFYGLTVLFGLSCAAAVTTAFHNPDPKIDTFRVSDVHAFRNGPHGDMSILRFDIKADLSSVFNWNVKQLFVFVYATHVDEQGRNHTTTIWDRIIRSPMDAELDLRDERTEYVLVDAEGRLRDKALSLHLSWDTMPYTGLLDLSSHGHADYTMPSEYVTPPPRGRGRGGGGGGSRRT